MQVNGKNSAITKDLEMIDEEERKKYSLTNKTTSQITSLVVSRWWNWNEIKKCMKCRVQPILLGEDFFVQVSEVFLHISLRIQGTLQPASCETQF